MLSTTGFYCYKAFDQQHCIGGKTKENVPETDGCQSVLAYSVLLVLTGGTDREEAEGVDLGSGIQT